MKLGAGDSGNVLALTNFKDTNRSQAFSYDSLNRITSAQNTGTDCNRKPVNPSQTVYWGNNYVYDPWGNLLQKIVTKCNAEPLSVNVDNTNHITSAGYSYDAAGNMTADGTDGVSARYDQENRITGANGFTYTYDADGERVEKSNGATGTLYWNMSPGIIGESDLNGVMKSEYVFFAGERIARRDYPSGAVAYYFSDHLKTTSIVTDSAGVIKNESDYYPWGGEVQLLANDSNHYKFNGKERDETGLDYYGARYYSNKLGRFVTPDWAGNAVAVPYANFGNPQSLNLYAYVENNPTTLGDVDGHLSRGSPTVLCPMGCPPPNMTEFFDFGCDEIVNHVCIPPDNPPFHYRPHHDCLKFCGHEEEAEKQAPPPKPSKVDKNKVADYMDKHASSKYGGKCASACRKGLEAGGLDTKGHPVDANNYGPFLEKLGAKPLAKENYKPEKGDVAVFQGGGRDKSGHIQIYDGKQWVSDTKQPRFSPRRDYPGDYTVYRFPD